MDKVNYYIKSLEELKTIPKDKKPKLLLHACCGPCSCFPLVFLCPHFDVTIYYNNSNIYPEAEYTRRLEELKKLLEYVKKDYGFFVNLLIPEYKNIEYTKNVLEPLKEYPEGSLRCFACYEARMAEAYDYAEANGYDYFTTVMSISRQKSSQKMNEIGAKLEKDHKHTKYFYSDFKKNKGIDEGRAIKNHYGLYSQTYCGCVYSYKARIEYDERNEK